MPLSIPFFVVFVLFIRLTCKSYFACSTSVGKEKLGRIKILPTSIGVLLVEVQTGSRDAKVEWLDSFFGFSEFEEISTLQPKDTLFKTHSYSVQNHFDSVKISHD